MDAEPVLQEEKPMSRFVYWLLGLLVVGTIFAAAAFMYYRSGNTESSNSSTPTDQPVTAKSTLESDIDSAQTDIASLSSDIDQELSEIDDSLASTEDDTSDL